MSAEMTQGGTATESKKKVSALEAILERKSRAIGFKVLKGERLPGSRVYYHVELEESDINEMLDEIIKEFARFAAVPGFRPGKAPAHLVRSRFDRSAREEMMKRITPRVVELIAGQNNHETLGTPVLHGYQCERGKPTELSVSFEIRPVITVTEENLNGISIESPKYFVDDASVDEAIESLRGRMASHVPAEAEHGFAKGDGILFDCTCIDEHGQVRADLSDRNFYTTEVEKFLPAEVVEALVGARKGATVEHEVRHTHTAQHEGDAAPHEHTHVLKFSIRVGELKKRVLPTLDDDFAKDIDAKAQNVAELKANLRKNLEAQAEDRTRREALAQVYDELTKRLQFELPQSLLEQMVQNNVVDVERRLRSMKMSLMQIDAAQRGALINRMAGNVQRDVRNYFVGDAIARSFGIVASEDQVKAELEAMAATSGRKPLAIQAAMEAQKTFDRFKDDLRIKLVNDRLISGTTIAYKETRLSGQPSDQQAALEEIAGQG